jgi:hypothetical protein
MSKTVSKFTLAAALALAITFTLSCSGGDDDGGNPSPGGGGSSSSDLGGNPGGGSSSSGNGDNPVSTPVNIGTGSVFTISGTFNNIGFKLIDAPPSVLSKARAVTGAFKDGNASSDDYAVTGAIKDGNTNIWVSGTYDPTDMTYSVSTSDGTLGKRYSITGAFDPSGNPTGSTATVLAKGDGNWTTGASYSVNEAAQVSITGNAFEAEAGGIPAIARGNWYYEGKNQFENDVIAQSFINQWNMVSYVAGETFYYEHYHREYETTTATVIEVEDKGSGKYNVILAYPLYALSTENDANEAKVVAAVTAFFSDKEFQPVKVPIWEGFDTPVPYYYIHVFNNNFVIHWGNFEESQWGLVNQFYSTNYLDKYLVSQSVAPAMRYEKRQFQLNGVNTELKMPRFVTGNANVFPSLQQAKNASLLDELNDVLPFTR